MGDKRKGRIENLSPTNTVSKEVARARGSMGGKKSVEVRKQKKLMSYIYAQFLADKHKVKIDGKDLEIAGDELVNQVVKKVLSRGDSASVSLMKEIREATEGSKIAVQTSESPVDPSKLDDETKKKIAQAYIQSIEHKD